MSQTLPMPSQPEPRPEALALDDKTQPRQGDGHESRILLMTRQVKSLFVLLWLLTKDGVHTFVGPNTIFGICGALSGPLLVLASGDSSGVLLRLPQVIMYNWSNYLVFQMANQRSPESALEDAENKPWRPVPSGLVTSNQLRQAMLLCIPAVFALNHFALDMGHETALQMLLAWLYNDLKGGDEHWALRNVIIAAAFGVYNTGSLKVASGVDHTAGLTPKGLQWVCTISGVILSTMHVQDLRDQTGDRVRGRCTAPITLGDTACRWTLVVPIGFWSWYCIHFWGLGLWGAGSAVLGTYLAIRCLTLSGPQSDGRTYELWALWAATLYMFPYLAHLKADITRI